MRIQADTPSTFIYLTKKKLIEIKNLNYKCPGFNMQQPVEMSANNTKYLAWKKKILYYLLLPIVRDFLERCVFVIISLEWLRFYFPWVSVSGVISLIQGVILTSLRSVPPLSIWLYINFIVQILPECSWRAGLVFVYGSWIVQWRGDETSELTMLHVQLVPWCSSLCVAACCMVPALSWHRT